MSLAWISVGASLLAVTLSCTTAIKVGILSLTLALVVGVLLGDLSPGAVLDGFPTELFVTLVGPMLLPAVAENYGTLAPIMARAESPSIQRRTAQPVRSRKRLALVLLLTIAPPIAATEQDPGAWVIATTTGAWGAEGTDSRWRYWLDAQARYFDFGSGASQYLIRPALGYELGEKTTAWFGYARFRTRTGSGEYFDEDRYWQQLNWNPGQLGDGNLALYARLEQRSVSRGDDLGITLRLMGRYTQALGMLGQADLVLMVEPFLDLVDTDWGGPSRLSQNRAFAGLGWRLSESVGLEAGYMNQFLWTDDGEDRSNHLVVVNFRLSY